MAKSKRDLSSIRDDYEALAEWLNKDALALIGKILDRHTGAMLKKLREMHDHTIRPDEILAILAENTSADDCMRKISDLAKSRQQTHVPTSRTAGDATTSRGDDS